MLGESDDDDDIGNENGNANGSDGADDWVWCYVSGILAAIKCHSSKHSEIECMISIL